MEVVLGGRSSCVARSTPKRQEQGSNSVPIAGIALAQGSEKILSLMRLMES